MDITIAKRFCGPPTTGNGGYVCGAIARLFPATVEVTLRAPPPLEVPLALTLHDDSAALEHEGVRLADARPATLELALPEPVTFEQAARAAEHYVGKHDHPYPTCFVCGPERRPGDGMRLFPGALEDRPVVAAPFVPDASIVDEHDLVLPEITWASLDCPGFFGMYTFAESRNPWWLLGRLTASVAKRPQRDERCVVMGWLLEREGRKAHTGSALFGENGEVYGFARGIWIELKK